MGLAKSRVPYLTGTRLWVYEYYANYPTRNRYKLGMSPPNARFNTRLSVNINMEWLPEETELLRYYLSKDLTYETISALLFVKLSRHHPERTRRGISAVQMKAKRLGSNNVLPSNLGETVSTYVADI